jgi:hypothetical protein
MSRFFEIDVTREVEQMRARNTAFLDYRNGKMTYAEWVKLDDQYASENMGAGATEKEAAVPTSRGDELPAMQSQ